MNHRQLLDQTYPLQRNTDPLPDIDERIFSLTKAASLNQPNLAVNELSVIIRLMMRRIEALENPVVEEPVTKAAPPLPKNAPPLPKKTVAAEEGE